MKGMLKGMTAVVFGGMGCFVTIVFVVVLAVVFAAAAVGNALPQPLQSMYFAWLLTGVPNQSDAVLPVGSSHIPFTGYDGPTGFVCAVPAQGATLTDCFGTPRVWGYHHGIDYGVPEGTPVTAPMSGMVTYAAFSPIGYGNLVVIENHGYQVLLAHNKSIAVHVGQVVMAGQVVAYSGNTGNSTGPHLHFEVRRANEKGSEAVDPATVFLPGQTEACNWYHLAPANEYETKGCEKFH